MDLVLLSYSDVLWVLKDLMALLVKQESKFGLW